MYLPPHKFQDGILMSSAVYMLLLFFVVVVCLFCFPLQLYKHSNLICRLVIWGEKEKNHNKSASSKVLV